MDALAIPAIFIHTAGYPGQAVPDIRIEATGHPDELRGMIRRLVKSTVAAGDGTGSGAEPVVEGGGSADHGIRSELQKIRRLPEAERWNGKNS